jgi:hypothetical protein
MFDPVSPTGVHFDLVTHEGDRCSFEVLIGRLGLSTQPARRRSPRSSTTST